MTNQRVRYEQAEGVGWIDIDDGTVNVMSTAMQEEIHAALDRAERDDVVTVLRGRPGVFSAGFDLEVLAEGAEASAAMVLGGFELARRVLSHPRPVLVACTGHAIAMGAFLVLSGDHRVGVRGSAKVSANEVAIGLTLPRSADVILRHRLTPAAHQRAALLAQSFTPDEAVAAGFLDELVDDDAGLDRRVRELAHALTLLDAGSHRDTKRRVRAVLLEQLDRAIADDRAEFDGRLASVGSSATLP
jgi:enoyl-CoA hydratase